MKIAFELVEALNNLRRNINRIDFNDVIWTKDDKSIEIPQEVKREWEFIGLNNTDFPEFYDVSQKKLREG